MLVLEDNWTGEALDAWLSVAVCSREACCYSSVGKWRLESDRDQLVVVGEGVEGRGRRERGCCGTAHVFLKRRKGSSKLGTRKG